MGKWCLPSPWMWQYSPFSQIIIFQTIRHTNKMRCQCQAISNKRGKSLSVLCYYNTYLCPPCIHYAITLRRVINFWARMWWKNINFSFFFASSAQPIKYVCSSVNNKSSAEAQFPFIRIRYRFTTSSFDAPISRLSFYGPDAECGSGKKERIYIIFFLADICHRLCCQNNNIFIEFVMPTRRRTTKRAEKKRRKKKMFEMGFVRIRISISIPK